MKINLLDKYIFQKTLSLILIGGSTLFSQISCAQTAVTAPAPDETIADPAVSIVFKDTLTLPSFKEFDLHVKMKPASEISAISLGFYFPEEYLEITGMELTHGAIGYNYNVTDSLIRMAWSSVIPIIISENDTIITLNLKTLDISGLSNTIKLEIYEYSEFADQSANIIEDVILEIPEIQFLIPEPGDSINGNYVSLYPNPFKNFTTIYFTLKAESQVGISVFNTAGMELKMFEEKTYPEGHHQVDINGLDLAKGVYMVKFAISNAETSGNKLFKIISIR